jgi:hypothetical protein
MTVTSTGLPFVSFTSPPSSSVDKFSMRSFPRFRSTASTAGCAFSGGFRPHQAKILSSVPGRVVVGCPTICVVCRFGSVILAGLDLRGFAIFPPDAGSCRVALSILALVPQHAHSTVPEGSPRSPLSGETPYKPPIPRASVARATAAPPPARIVHIGADPWLRDDCWNQAGWLGNHSAAGCGGGDGRSLSRDVNAAGELCCDQDLSERAFRGSRAVSKLRTKPGISQAAPNNSFSSLRRDAAPRLPGSRCDQTRVWLPRIAR